MSLLEIVSWGSLLMIFLTACATVLANEDSLSPPLLMGSKSFHRFLRSEVRNIETAELMVEELLNLKIKEINNLHEIEEILDRVGFLQQELQELTKKSAEEIDQKTLDRISAVNIRSVMVAERLEARIEEIIERSEIRKSA